MTDLLHLVGVVPYDKKMSKAEDKGQGLKRLLHGAREKIKHRNIFELRETALKDLYERPTHPPPPPPHPAQSSYTHPPSTTCIATDFATVHRCDDDLELIMTAEDENSRHGDWRRIFPCESMAKTYLPLFEFARYRNTVLAKWMDRPDWSLLRPMLDPSLPPATFAALREQESKRVAEVATPSSLRAAASRAASAAATDIATNLASAPSAVSGAAAGRGGGTANRSGGATAARAAVVAAAIAAAAPEATDAVNGAADGVGPAAGPAIGPAGGPAAGGGRTAGGSVGSVSMATCAQAASVSVEESAGPHAPTTHPLLSHSAGPPTAISAPYSCSGGNRLAAASSCAAGVGAVAAGGGIGSIANVGASRRHAYAMLQARLGGANGSASTSDVAPLSGGAAAKAQSLAASIPLPIPLLTSLGQGSCTNLGSASEAAAAASSSVGGRAADTNGLVGGAAGGTASATTRSSPVRISLTQPFAQRVSAAPSPVRVS